MPERLEFEVYYKKSAINPLTLYLYLDQATFINSTMDMTPVLLSNYQLAIAKLSNSVFNKLYMHNLCKITFI